MITYSPTSLCSQAGGPKPSGGHSTLVVLTPTATDLACRSSHIVSAEEISCLLWSRSKKRGVLIALLSASLLCDMGMTWGTTLFEAQAQTWKMPIPAIANSLSGGIFLQGAGGILAVPLTQRYGRLPILFWSQLLSCIVVLAAAFSPSLILFTACRTLQGFFNTAPQVIGLSIIHDLFGFEERTRKINLWAFSFLCGPFLGPFFSGLLIRKTSWRAVYAVLAAMHGLSLLLVIVLGEESLCARLPEHPGCSQPRKIVRLLGSKPPDYRPTLQEVITRAFRMAVKPHLLLPTAMYTCVSFMWVIGIVTTITQFIKPPPYQFSDLAVALVFLAPFAGAVLAEFWGRFFNDLLQHRYVQQHNGHHAPENRLWATYPAAIMTTCGIVLYGQTLQHQLHWSGLVFGWAMTAAGALASTTAISAYVMDCFPENVAAASSWIDFWRTTGKRMLGEWESCLLMVDRRILASYTSSWNGSQRQGPAQHLVSRPESSVSLSAQSLQHMCGVSNGDNRIDSFLPLDE